MSDYPPLPFRPGQRAPGADFYNKLVADARRSMLGSPAGGEVGAEGMIIPPPGLWEHEEVGPFLAKITGVKGTLPALYSWTKVVQDPTYIYTTDPGGATDGSTSSGNIGAVGTYPAFELNNNGNVDTSGNTVVELRASRVGPAFWFAPPATATSGNTINVGQIDDAGTIPSTPHATFTGVATTIVADGNSGIYCSLSGGGGTFELRGIEANIYPHSSVGGFYPGIVTSGEQFWLNNKVLVDNVPSVASEPQWAVGMVVSDVSATAYVFGRYNPSGLGATRAAIEGNTGGFDLTVGNLQEGNLFLYTSPGGTTQQAAVDEGSGANTAHTIIASGPNVTASNIKITLSGGSNVLDLGNSGTFLPGSPAANPAFSCRGNKGVDSSAIVFVDAGGTSRTLQTVGGIVTKLS